MQEAIDKLKADKDRLGVQVAHAEKALNDLNQRVVLAKQTVFKLGIELAATTKALETLEGMVEEDAGD